MVEAIANGLWHAACLPGAAAFRRALDDVAGAQERILRRLLAANAATDYGRRHGFADIRGVDGYRERVPLTTYEDYQEAIARIGAGEPGVLTREPVLLLERTSGSTAPTKLIPYTAGLKAEFGRAIAPWIADLFHHDPALRRGRAYWSVSPVVRRGERSAGGIPIGFEEDTAYLGRLQSRLVDGVLAVPPLVKHVDDLDTFRYLTLLFLLRSRSLALISVWNPTFLTLLLERLREWRPHLARDIGAGTLSPPACLAPDLRRRLSARLRPDARRAAEVAAALAEAEPGAAHARLWPGLRLISCWTDGHAASHAADLARLFPQARLQGKGLIATEGIVSLPLVGHEGAALAVRSHFFEFLPADGLSGEAAGDATLLAHELQPGAHYAVVLTTGGGLYRYQLQDIVRVVGRIGACPLLRFVGKAAAISDRFGEKLHEGHVRQVLDRLLPRRGDDGPARFAMIAFEPAGAPPAYALFVEAGDLPDARLRALGAEVELALAENFHYRYCRDLGQLGPLRVFRVEGRGALDAYLSACRAHGQRLGDIKPVALHRASGWSATFRGRFVSGESPSEAAAYPDRGVS